MPSRFLNQMIADLRSTSDAKPSGDGTGSQHGLRIELPFPATVRGVDATGERFTVDTVLDSLSAHELCLRLARSVGPGARLFIVVRLSIDRAGVERTARVAMHGVVKDVDLEADGGCDLVVTFDRHRFLYATTI